MRSLRPATGEQPLLPSTREKPTCSNEDPALPKKKKKKLVKVRIRESMSTFGKRLGISNGTYGTARRVDESG